MLKKLEKLKDEPKRERNLVLKATKDTHWTKEDEIAYIAKQVLKALKISGDLCRRDESSKYLNEGKNNGTNHKCGKLGHYIRDYLMLKVEYKVYVKQFVEKERGKEHVPGKYNRKAEAKKVANKVLATYWGDSDEWGQGKNISMVVMEEEAWFLTHSLPLWQTW